MLLYQMPRYNNDEDELEPGGEKKPRAKAPPSDTSGLSLSDTESSYVISPPLDSRAVGKEGDEMRPKLWACGHGNIEVFVEWDNVNLSSPAHTKHLVESFFSLVLWFANAYATHEQSRMHPAVHSCKFRFGTSVYHQFGSFMFWISAKPSTHCTGSFLRHPPEKLPFLHSASAPLLG
ncbi:hypothetical protein PR202_gb23217 [Eleusine coracana subsp. coracana]|uniref:Uncharacterized protein n=1 Tax=Eleusine coracana subsp. coracana TaxID=191504 RepID=A0AAV5FJP3_ELECO|nr:hypothetical protein PR202_gb23217 [Eleusine coracana subsp. coracana]